MNWYDKVFRKVHWDFDNPAFVRGIGEKFNPDTFIVTLKRAKVQGINFFPKDFFGLFYYDTKLGNKHPGLKRNLLKEITESCKKNNIKVMFHYNSVDKRIAEIHPDWRTVELHKVVRDFPKANWDQWYLCFNSPYLEQVLIPQVEELITEFHPDGFFLDIVSQLIFSPCYCHYCQDKFQQEYPGTLPRSKGDPLWSTWGKWRRKIVTEFVRKLADTIHNINPNVLVASNYAYSTRQPEIPPDYLDYFTLDVVESEQVALGCSFEARYWSTLKRPFDIMNTRFLYWWSDWMLKPVASLKQECATIIANGGRCFIGDKMYPNGSLDSEAFKSIGETFEFIQKREKFCCDAEPVPYIGIIHSSSTLYDKVAGLLPTYNQIDPATKSPNQGYSAIRGAHKALVESNFHFSILNEFTLMKEISTYKLLLLPEQTILGDEVANRIKEFVWNGGSLLISYVTNPLLQEAAGINCKAEYEYPLGYIVARDEKVRREIGDFAILTQAKFLLVQPTLAKVLCSLLKPLWADESLEPVHQGPPGEDTCYPAVTINEFGKGKVAYVSGEIFSAYWEKNNPHLKYLIKTLVDLITTDKIIEVEAPPSIEVSLFRQGERWIVHLVNFHTEKVVSGISFAEHIPPVQGIKVKLKVDRKVKRVTQQPEGNKLKYTTHGHYISIEVPKLQIHTMLVIE